MQKLLTFFSKHINVYAIFMDKSFNAKLTNDIVSFEQLGPGINIFSDKMFRSAPSKRLRPNLLSRS